MTHPREPQVSARQPVASQHTNSAYSRHASERGMAIFIVMLAITLLTGLGLWAARSTSMVDAASGYSRQALQAQYIADLGVQTTSAFLGAGRGDGLIRIADQGTETCAQNSGVSGFCHWFDPAEIQAAYGTEKLVAPAGADPGEASLGSFSTTDAGAELTGDFIVEMTDKGPPGPLPGAELDDANRIRQASVALTSFGTVRPAGAAAANECNVLSASVAGRQTLRATTIVSPLFE